MPFSQVAMDLSGEDSHTEEITGNNTLKYLTFQIFFIQNYHLK